MCQKCPLKRIPFLDKEKKDDPNNINMLIKKINQKAITREKPMEL